MPGLIPAGDIGRPAVESRAGSATLAQQRIPQLVFLFGVGLQTAPFREGLPIDLFHSEKWRPGSVRCAVRDLRTNPARTDPRVVGRHILTKLVANWFDAAGVPVVIIRPDLKDP